MLRNMAIATIPALGDEQLAVLDTVAREFEEAFAELSEDADRELSGKAFVFSRYGRELYPYFEETDDRLVPGCILPIKEGRPVSSVDSTCVLVGETSQGALYAARTAVGISLEGSLRRFFRLGPILVYATSNGLSGLRRQTTRDELDLILTDHAVAERFIRNAVERRVVDALVTGEQETIVMADGSLKHPSGQFTRHSIQRQRRQNCLVGFSKSSNLILSEGAVGALTSHLGPCFYGVDDGPVRTVLAKFTSDGLIFRLDLSGSEEPAQTTLGRIMWNDAFSSGYPDSLKVAHHLSIFSRAECQAIKAFVAKRFRVRQLSTFPLRKVALGGFRGSA
jgi:hypothetical protein